MNNIFGLSNLKSFGQLKSLPGSSSGAGKTLSISSRASSDSYSLGSFANLKLTAGIFCSHFGFRVEICRKSIIWFLFFLNFI